MMIELVNAPITVVTVSRSKRLVSSTFTAVEQLCNVIVIWLTWIWGRFPDWMRSTCSAWVDHILIVVFIIIVFIVVWVNRFIIFKAASTPMGMYWWAISFCINSFNIIFANIKQLLLKQFCLLRLFVFNLH